MGVVEDFESRFEDLTGFPPFSWQKRLCRDFVSGNIPSALDLPTGLGKTSVMAIWYLAFKAGANIPRRLVYVVDRRAVVDQATTVADRIRAKADDKNLRVSTLRGQHIDNREWLTDPSAPSIIVGTVDMTGSRLLFSGYGVTRRMRPYHAGLLGADSLVVLDEAHLVPPFEQLLRSITGETETFGPQTRHSAIIPSIKLLSLSATGRGSTPGKSTAFRLLPEEKEDARVKKRLEAKKRLTIEILDDKTTLANTLKDRALHLVEQYGPARLLIYCNERKDAEDVEQLISKKYKAQTNLLVGGRRIKEREELANWLQQHGFISNSGKRRPQQQKQQVDLFAQQESANGSEMSPNEPVFLIATSAGEVGVDLDADHIVCDLVEWERMVQRFGRVNRRGNGAAQIEVIAAPPSTGAIKKWQKRSSFREYLDNLRNVEGNEIDLPSLIITLLRKPLDSLRRAEEGDERDASPAAILDLRASAQENPQLQEQIDAATTPAPLHPALNRALVDAWSMTSLEKHTGRPDIQPWLRGWEENEPHQTTVIWRKYLPICKGRTPAKEIKAFFEAAPPHASEKLDTDTDRVIAWLEKRAKNISKMQIDNTNQETAPDTENVIGYILSTDMDLRDQLFWTTLRTEQLKPKLDEKSKGDLKGGILVVNRNFKGLSEKGMLDPEASELPSTVDGEDEWLPSDEPNNPVVRFRVSQRSKDEEMSKDANWRERHRFNTELSEEGEAQGFLLVEKWRHASETEDDLSVGRRLQELEEHHAWTERKARELAQRLQLPEDYTEMLACAARLHDEGKRHERWQRAAHAPKDGGPYAKTKRMNPKLLDGYRHEFGSLPYIKDDKSFGELSDELQELVLHLVAAHHGWARPVIPMTGGDAPPSVLEKRARDVALRFARLQKRWGPWRLAWWEALLRAADQQASRDNDDPDQSTDDQTEEQN